MARMYMPLEQRTEMSTSAPSHVVTSSSWIVNRPRGQLDVLAVADPLVGTLAVHLDGGDGGGHLVDLADERAERLADLASVRPSSAWSRRPRPRRRRWSSRPEADRRVVPLLGQHQVTEQPGRPVDAEHRARRSPSGRACRRGRPCGCPRAGVPGRRRRATSCRRLVDDDQPVGDGRVTRPGSSPSQSRRRHRGRRPRAALVGVLLAAYAVPRAPRPPRRGPGPREHLVEGARVSGRRRGRRSASARCACRAAWRPRSGSRPWRTERGGRALALLVGTEDGVEDRRLLAVAGDADVGHGEKPRRGP